MTSDTGSFSAWLPQPKVSKFFATAAGVERRAVGEGDALADLEECTPWRR